MNEKDFDELFDEMLDLAGVNSLNEKKDEADKEDSEKESPVEDDDKTKGEKDQEEEETTDEKEIKGEVNDEWDKKIAGQELKMIWKNNDKVLRIRFKGGSAVEWKVPTKLVDNPVYRKPFKAFLLKLVNYMSGIENKEVIQ
jgi:hypothetical protein